MADQKHHKRLLLALVPIAFLASFSPTTSLAADKGGSAVASAGHEAPPSSGWTGCYIAGGVGIVAGIMDPIFGVDGYGYGVRVGCDIKAGVLVVGGLVDYDWKHVKVGSTTFTPHSWDFGGRAGVLVNSNALAYAVITRPTLSITGMPDSTGLGFGGGIETKLNNNFSVSLEYLRSTYDKIPNAREHDLTVRLSYHLPVLDGWFNK